MRNRMELLPADSPERQLLADNLLRALLNGRLEPRDVELLCAADFSAGRFCVLDIDGSAVGTISLRPFTSFPGVFEIRSLAVAKSWQHAGLAQFMLDRTITTAREQGAKILRATVHSALTEAVGFFRKNDFRPADKQNISDDFTGIYTLARKI